MINNLLLVVSPKPKLCFARTSKFNFDSVHFNANLSKGRRLALRPRAFPKFTLSSSLQTETDLENAAFQGPKNNNSPILLDVTGMMCGACVSRVKSILSADERVESAVVNMLTETAAVKLKPEALLEGEVSASIGESLAKRLSECGFEAKKRVSGNGVAENVKKWKDMVKKKEELIAKSRNRVVFAWTLVALCCGSHASHILHSLGIHVGHGNYHTHVM
jgi:Cu2+-exporting ATPase